MYPGEVFGHVAGLVGLQRADEMPDDVVEIGEFRLLLQGFLDVVLAELTLAEMPGLTHQRRRLGLADRQQAGVAGRASGLVQGRGSPDVDGGERRGQRTGGRRGRYVASYVIMCITRWPPDFESKGKRIDITELLAISAKQKASDLHR